MADDARAGPGVVDQGGDSARAVVLASASPVRAALLHRAGVAFTAEPAAVDEEGLKAALRAEGASAPEAAETLAELKATRVSRRHPQAFVIGADQILECEGAWFDKPADRAGARRDLVALRGRAHHQHTAVCVAREGTRLWHHVARARLVMRDFSDAFLERYLEGAGEDILTSVGAYQLESIGVQLFSSVEGDHFAILGLPLLPLLGFLREHDVVAR